MELLLEVISSEKHLMGDNAHHVFKPAGGVIGRAPECDWVIPDQTRHISGRHAIISYEAGQFYITDTSTNGVYLNGVETLHKNQATPLADGDRLLMGQIHFLVRVELQAEAAAPAGHAIPKPTSFSANPLNNGANPMEKVDEWAAQQKPAEAEQPQWHQNSSSMPDQVAPQHEPFDPPAVKAVSSDNAHELPENWWEEDEGQGPVPDAIPDKLPGKESIPPLPEWEEDSKTAIAPIPDAVKPKVDSTAALKALADGLGVDWKELEKAGGTEFMRKAGLLLRICMRGMVGASQARASLKNEFRLDMTLVHSKDNNPIKFSANGEQAIKHLLTNEMGSFLSMDEALQECFDDIQHHQLAMMAGMQGAFMDLMQTLSPQALEKRFDRNKASGLSLGSKSARYWEAYRELHQDLLAEDDIFASLFAEPFAHAYDDQIAKLKRSKKNKE